MSRCPDVLESYCACAFNIRTPLPGGLRTYLFFFPLKIGKIALTQEDIPKIWVYLVKNMGLPPKNIVIPL